MSQWDQAVDEEAGKRQQRKAREGEALNLELPDHEQDKPELNCNAQEFFHAKGGTRG